MVEVQGKGGISAKIIADSVSPAGKRVTTYELNYPRFVHAEFMTHRLFSRNAASSRAIPVPKMIDNIKANTAMPIPSWGSSTYYSVMATGCLPVAPPRWEPSPCARRSVPLVWKVPMLP